MAAVGRDWCKCKELQARPVVLNALQATKDIKGFISQVFGPGAISLGTVGTERAWWVAVLRNVSPTAVWGTCAYLQYRAVVTWKHQVLVGLRRYYRFVSACDAYALVAALSFDGARMFTCFRCLCSFRAFVCLNPDTARRMSTLKNNPTYVELVESVEFGCTRSPILAVASRPEPVSPDCVNIGLDDFRRRLA